MASVALCVCAPAARAASSAATSATLVRMSIDLAVIAPARPGASLGPRRLDAVHPCVRDELAQVLVQVARHAERDVRRRRVTAEELPRPDERRRVHALDRLAAVRVALLQVLDHV